MQKMIGVDLGGTRIKVGIVIGGELADSISVNTQAESGPAHVLDVIADAVKRLDSKPPAVGLAIPGGVNPEGFCWRLPNVPGFEGVNISAELRARLGCRVVVENDATTAALAELHLGHGRGHQSFAMITLGTGIGGGIVIDGRLRRGRHGFAGEIGHTPIDRSEAGWPCACGLRGCVESYAGTRGLLRKYAELGGTADEVRPIAEAARQGNSAARETFAAMGQALGIGLAALQNTLDLDAIVFTGGISPSFDLVKSSLRASLTKNVFGPPLAEVPLLVSELGDRTGLLGAAYLSTL
jgi:predicted NBD/HSP70 family sugar kinase